MSVLDTRFVKSIKEAVEWTNNPGVKVKGKSLYRTWDDGEQLHEQPLFFLDQISSFVFDRERCLLIIYFDVDGVYTIGRQAVV